MSTSTCMHPSAPAIRGLGRRATSLAPALALAGLVLAGLVLPSLAHAAPAGPPAGAADPQAQDTHSSSTASRAAPSKLPVFTDVTTQAGISFMHSLGDDELSNIVESTGAGTCFFDADGDGLLDIYLVNGAYIKHVSHVRGRINAGRLHNTLYRNNGDGTFTDITEAAGVGHTGYGMACLSADYDNDGDADLFVTNYGPDVLYRNDGSGHFTDVTDAAGVASSSWSVGCTFFDLDSDGLLDLYVGGYLVFDPEYRLYYAAEAFPGPLSYRGEKDQLYRNKGDGTFERISEAAGIANPEGRAMGLAAGDVDDDGDMDVFVANDGMENYLYLNQGNGTFTNSAMLANTAFGQNGEATSAMGPELGDFNRDGLIDVMVPDMGYGCLYANTGKGYFEELSARLGVAAVLGQYTSWSGNFFDLDNDTFLDVFLTNGDAHHLEPEEDTLLRNDGGTRFVDVSKLCGKDLKAKYVSRGSATGDYDNDGDLDIIELNINGPARLLRNDGGNRASYLMIHAVGTRSNRDAIGARVRVTTGGVTQTSMVRSSSGYLSQSDHRVHFGLGTAKKVDRIEIRWPSGTIQVLENVAANQVLEIIEPRTASRKADGDAAGTDPKTETKANVAPTPSHDDGEEQ